MTEISLQDIFNQAVQYHQAGQLDIAWKMYLQLLTHLPDNPEILWLMGIASNQTSQFTQAESLIRKAISLNPRNARYYCDLSDSLRAQGKTKEALEICQHALSIDPNLAAGWNTLGNILMTQEDFAQAAEHYRRAQSIQPDFAQAIGNLGNALRRLNRMEESLIALQRAKSLNPNQPEVHSNLSLVLQKLGRLDEAIAAARQTLALAPSLPGARNNLGNLLMEKGALPQALEQFEIAVALDPQHAQAHHNRGLMLFRLGRFQESVLAHQKAVELNPKSAEMLSNLGSALRKVKRYDEAANAYQKALELDPRFAPALNNLGVVLKETGLLDPSIEAFRKSIDIDPQSPYAHSNLLLTLQYDPNLSLDEEKKERELWSRRHETGLCTSPAPMPPAHPDRLRVGFVSSDLYYHPVGRFLLPLLAHLDKNQFFIACFSDCILQDDITQQLRSHADLWIDSAMLNDEQLDQRVRHENIHILIDLSAHTAGNRLLTFARKPSPLQITWLAYCGSTGLKSMDFRISDPYMDPGQFDAWHTEKTLRLPNTYWCYPPPPAQDPLTPPPSTNKGFITFGCFNTLCKMSPLTVQCWTTILKTVPHSMLKIHAPECSCRTRIMNVFQNAGIDPSRLAFQSFLPRKDYFNAYNEIDIALDPFPFNGGTTSLDALWMGAPLITLCGDRPVGRAGLSILSNLNLTKFVAQSTDDYIQKAIDLANQPEKLAELRMSLRNRMQNSSLMDARRFADDFAALLIKAWKTKK